jgi:hypothetical protein
MLARKGKTMPTRYVLTILALLALAAPPSPAQAGGVVTVCDEAHLLAALAGGGTLTFACSGTITLSAEIVIAADTTIDGSGQEVTISGNNAVRVFTVNEGVTLALDRLTVANGLGNSSGGGIDNDQGAAIISNCTFSNNNAGTYGCGGAIANSGTLTVTNSNFSGNSGGYLGGGGVICNSQGAVTVSNSTFSGNSAGLGGSGGAIQNSGTLIVTKSTFSNNSAPAESSNLSGGGVGGGIANEGGTVNVSNSTFSSNYGSYGGAGIHNFINGTLTVSNSTFSGNRGSPSASGGGGIMSAGIILIVTNSTFFDNEAVTGGGISTRYGTATVSNSTFAGNSAYFEGGGIFNRGALTLKNTIVANSPTGNNCDGTATDGGGNLSYPDTTCPGINADPKLGPLQNNLGPTLTMALGSGSAAIDVGIDAICAAAPVNGLDQRGIARPWGAHCDIGAVEQVPIKKLWLPILLSR